MTRVSLKVIVHFLLVCLDCAWNFDFEYLPCLLIKALFNIAEFLDLINSLPTIVPSADNLCKQFGPR